MDEERERPPDPGGPSGAGTPPADPDYHLHTELAEETKRLATHPREEAHRLAEELREGETETTPLIAMSGLALGIGVLLAILIALAFLIPASCRSSREELRRLEAERRARVEQRLGIGPRHTVN
jgi:hypothetical protein